MKFIPELLLSIFLHPIAVLLMILNILARQDLGRGGKLAWILFGTLAWGVGPVLYVAFGGGELW